MRGFGAFTTLLLASLPSVSQSLPFGAFVQCMRNQRKRDNRRNCNTRFTSGLTGKPDVVAQALLQRSSRLRRGVS